MELTKEQIQYIENRLIKEGVKYWDIRIEMLDHIVTDVEQQLENGGLFKNAVQNSFVALGWKENFNGGGLDTIVIERIKSLQQKHRKNYNAYVVKILKEPKTIVLISILGFFFSVISNNPKLIKFMTSGYVILMGATMLLLLFNKRIYKSIQLNTALIRATFSMTIINIIVFVPKIFEYDIFKTPYLMSFILFLALMDSALGFDFFVSEYKKVNGTYKKLLS